MKGQIYFSPASKSKHINYCGESNAGNAGSIFFDSEPSKADFLALSYSALFEAIFRDFENNKDFIIEVLRLILIEAKPK